MKRGEKIVGWFESYDQYRRVSKEMIDSLGGDTKVVYQSATDAKYASEIGYLEIQSTLTATQIRWRFTQFSDITPRIFIGMCMEIQPSQEEVEDWIITAD